MHLHLLSEILTILTIEWLTLGPQEHTISAAFSVQDSILCHLHTMLGEDLEDIAPLRRKCTEVWAS